MSAAAHERDGRLRRRTRGAHTSTSCWCTARHLVPGRRGPEGREPLGKRRGPGGEARNRDARLPHGARVEEVPQMTIGAIEATPSAAASRCRAAFDWRVIAERRGSPHYPRSRLASRSPGAPPAARESVARARQAPGDTVRTVPAAEALAIGLVGLRHGARQGDHTARRGRPSRARDPARFRAHDQRSANPYAALGAHATGYIGARPGRIRRGEHRGKGRARGLSRDGAEATARRSEVAALQRPVPASSSNRLGSALGSRPYCRD